MLVAAGKLSYLAHLLKASVICSVWRIDIDSMLLYLQVYAAKHGFRLLCLSLLALSFSIAAVHQLMLYAEGGGGKIKLLEAGAYKDQGVDISLITHPGITADSALMSTSAYNSFKVEYFGKVSHGQWYM